MNSASDAFLRVRKINIEITKNKQNKNFQPLTNIVPSLKPDRENSLQFAVKVAIPTFCWSQAYELLPAAFILLT